MNRIVSIVLLFFLVAKASAQDQYYIVLHVKGLVKLKSTGEVLKPGDKVGEEAQVVFGSAEALAAVMHPAKGRFLMKPNSGEEQGGEGELLSLVRSTLVEGTGRASTRAGRLTNDLAFQQLLRANPQEYFNGHFAFIGDTAALQVSTETYPLTKADFFFVRYQYQGEVVNKKVPFEGDRIRFSAGELFQVDEKPIRPEAASGFQLFFRKSATSESRLICDFNPIFVNIEQLKQEYELLQPYLKGLSVQEKVAEFQAYMADAHGKADPGAIKAFIENIENSTGK